MPANMAGVGFGTCLVALDASVCLSVNALLPHVAVEFGFGQSHAAMLLTAPFYAGRVLAYMVAPALLTVLSAQSIVGACALLLSLSTAWLANGRSLVECALARLACGLASGPALLAVLSLFARRTPSQAAPTLHSLYLGSVLGALATQAPFMELIRTVGWRRATLCASSLPAVLIALLVVWASAKGTAEAQPRLLGSAHRQRMARIDSNASSCTRSLPDSSGGDVEAGCSDGCLGAVREPHFALFVGAASCLHAAIDQLGGPLGFLALQHGFRSSAHAWTSGQALIGTTLVLTAALAAQCAAMLLAQPRSIAKSALLAAVHCGCLCVAVLALALLPASLPAMPFASIVLAALALGGSAAAGLLPLSQILLEASTSAQRAPSMALVGALSSALGGALAMTYPLLLPDPHAQAAAPGPASPLAPALLLMLGATATGCAVWLKRWMSTAEMIEHVLILSLESADEARAVETVRDSYRKLSSAIARATRGEGDVAAGSCLAEQRLLSSPETARDVRQKGSIETMSAFTNGGAAGSPPKPYAVDKLVRAQMGLGLGQHKSPVRQGASEGRPS